MSSIAYSRWTQFVGDPQDLLCRFNTAVKAGEPDPFALSRAVIVGLSAAWETYVEHVAVETARFVLALPDLIALQTEADSRFHNPNSNHVRALVVRAIGRDPWPHIVVMGRTERETREAVDRHQIMRHSIAHGISRPCLGSARLVERTEFFRELVGNLDSFLAGELQSKLGFPPW